MTFFLHDNKRIRKTLYPSWEFCNNSLILTRISRHTVLKCPVRLSPSFLASLGTSATYQQICAIPCQMVKHRIVSLADRTTEIELLRFPLLRRNQFTRNF